MVDYSEITAALIAFDEDRVAQLVQEALDDGREAADILNDGLIAGMDTIGEKMETGDIFIPEVLMAAKAMGGAMDLLTPHLADGAGSARGKVVIGTVQGDLHDIGKNLVALMLESTGMEVHNLGVDVTPEVFAAAVQEKQPQVLCMSALLTTTMPMMLRTLKELTESGLRDRVRVMVGGAPVTQVFADQIGADGYAPDAGSAAKLAKALVGV